MRLHRGVIELATEDARVGELDPRQRVRSGDKTNDSPRATQRLVNLKGDHIRQRAAWLDIGEDGDIAALMIITRAIEPNTRRLRAPGRVPRPEFSGGGDEANRAPWPS